MAEQNDYHLCNSNIELKQALDQNKDMSQRLYMKSAAMVLKHLN